LKPDLLRNVPLLAPLSDAELSLLAPSFNCRQFPAGTILFHEGDPGENFSILLSGEIEIVKALDTIEERLLAVLGPGDFLGEMSLFDPGKLRSASARTRSDVEWAEITPSAFESLLHRLPALSFRLVRELNTRLRRSEANTVRDLQIKNQALTQAYLDLQQAQSDLVEKEKLEHELEIAREIQESILPKQIPVLPGWQITAYWQPARAVSGDFYDFIPYPDGRLGLLIADATGKGVPAALVMAVTCSILRTVVGSETSPGAILEQVNNFVCLYMPPKMFVTCLYVLLDPDSGRVRFANAGHNLAIKVAHGTVQELRATGMPLGLLPEMTYEENEVYVEPGSGLLMYTDGIVEAHNSNREMFGTPRLQTCLAETPLKPDVVDHLLSHLVEFTGPDWEQEDDVTFIILTCPQPD
jgi:sigma-B regulation protein RsbU (phosphoserine phosphatase)